MTKDSGHVMVLQIKEGKYRSEPKSLCKSDGQRILSVSIIYPPLIALAPQTIKVMRQHHLANDGNDKDKDTNNFSDTPDDVQGASR